MAKSTNYNWTTYGDGVTEINFQTDITKFINDVDAKLKAVEIERGSNSNGRWVKFGDGTMICSYSSPSSVDFNDSVENSGIYRGSIPITYPVPFVDLPSVTVNGDIRYDTQLRIGTLSTRTQGTTSGCTLDVKTTAVADRVYGLKYIAIGRWK